jgi:uncharacterized protein YuzE
MEPKFNLTVTVETDDKTGETLAAYLKVREGKVDETREHGNGRVNVDYDADGKILGVELLAPCEIKVLDDIADEEPQSQTLRRFFHESPPRKFVLA